MNRQTNQSKRNHGQQGGKRPQKSQTPRAIILIYIVMLVVILAICAVVFTVTLDKTDGSNDFSSDSLETSSEVLSETSENSNMYSSTSSDDSSSVTLSVSSESSSGAEFSQTSTAVSSSSSSYTVSSNDSSAVSSSSTVVSSEDPVIVSSAMTLLGANMVYVGESYRYSYKTTENVAIFPDIEWECVGNSGTITQNGEFTALEKGELTLIVRDVANNLSAKLLVHVVNSAEDVDFVPMVNNITIVNKTYPLPSDYAPGGLTAETSAAFERLVKAAATDGLNIYMISGYRSYEKQQKTYLGWCNTYGTQQADRISARPGFSEHQLGMAIDVNSLYESFEDTAEGKWLAEHCWEYGFVIRYPKGKESYTGYSYEPWHIRYLGDVELAKSVTESGLCLEEYLGIDSKYRD